MESVENRKRLAEIENHYVLLMQREKNHLSKEEIRKNAEDILRLLPADKVYALQIGKVLYCRDVKNTLHGKVLRLENVRFIFKGRFS